MSELNGNLHPGLPILILLTVIKYINDIKRKSSVVNFVKNNLRYILFNKCDLALVINLMGLWQKCENECHLYF